MATNQPRRHFFHRAAHSQRLGSYQAFSHQYHLQPKRSDFLTYPMVVLPTPGGPQTSVTWPFGMPPVSSGPSG